MEEGSRHGALLWAAAMVHADHVNLWWGVELQIPLLKHTKYFYFCVKSKCQPMPTRGKWIATTDLDGEFHKLLTNSVKMGGISIRNPVNTDVHVHETTLSATSHLVTSTVDKDALLDLVEDHHDSVVR